MEIFEDKAILTPVVITHTSIQMIKALGRQIKEMWFYICEYCGAKDDIYCNDDSYKYLDFISQYSLDRREVKRTLHLVISGETKPSNEAIMPIIN